MDSHKIIAEVAATKLVFNIISFTKNDYTNIDSGRTPAQPVNINLLTTGAATNNGDGTYTAISSLAVPLDATGSGVVALQGHPAGASSSGEYTVRVPATSVVSYFPISNTTATPRRKIVDIENCQTCHESLSLHGSNRNNEIAVCVICHNADATDIKVRLSDTSLMADGKVEEGGNFSFILYKEAESTSRSNGPDGTQPAGHTSRTDCSSCHE